MHRNLHGLVDSVQKISKLDLIAKTIKSAARSWCLLALCLAAVLSPVPACPSPLENGQGPDKTSQAVPLEPSIENISIINDNRALYISFMLVNGFPPDVSSAIQSGITVTFLFDIRLEAPGTFMNSTVVSRSLERRIKYDTLKNEYMVSFDPASPRVIVVNSGREARKLVSTVSHVLLVELDALARGTVYKIRVRSSVEKEESAIAFSDMLNLFSSWGFETGWHEVVFNY